MKVKTELFTVVRLQMYTTLTKSIPNVWQGRTISLTSTNSREALELINWYKLLVGIWLTC